MDGKLCGADLEAYQRPEGNVQTPFKERLSVHTIEQRIVKKYWMLSQNERGKYSKGI
jgi:hypothetical protein